MIEVRKEIYAEEINRLLRQQYKFSPNLINILTDFSGQIQQLENALYDFYFYNQNFGVYLNPDNNLDPIVQIGRHFNVLITEPINTKDIIERALASVWVAVSNGRPEDLIGLSNFVYGYKSNLHDARGALVLTIQGEISDENGRKGKVLYDAARKMMPPTVKLSYISESDPNAGFSFSEFGGDGAVGFSSVVQFGGFSFARIVIDGQGNFVGSS